MDDDSNNHEEKMMIILLLLMMTTKKKEKKKMMIMMMAVAAMIMTRVTCKLRRLLSKQHCILTAACYPRILPSGILQGSKFLGSPPLIWYCLLSSLLLKVITMPAVNMVFCTNQFF